MDFNRNLARISGRDKLRVGWLTKVSWEGYHESRRCSRETYPESYITNYTSIRRLKHIVAAQSKFS